MSWEIDQSSLLVRWPFLKYLDFEFIESIVQVFSIPPIENTKTKETLFLIIIDDQHQVFAIIQKNEEIIINKINILNQKKLIKIEFGKYFCLSLTNDGDIYSWFFNNNDKEELKTTTINVQKVLIKNFDDKKPLPKFIDLSCTTEKFKGLARCEENYLYYIDYLGKGTFELRKNLLNAKSLSIDCNEDQCFFINENKRLASEDGLIFPKQNENVIKVACGKNKGFLLTDDGKIFLFKDENYLEPMKNVEDLDYKYFYELGPYDDIKACSFQDIYGFKNQNGFYFKLKNKTLFNCCSVMEEYFEFLTTPINVKKSIYNLNLRICYEFDKEMYSNFSFIVEDKPIYVQKQIVMIRCDYLDMMLSNKWKNSEETTHVIKCFSYKVYKAFLQYLYTNVLEKLDLESTFALRDLAICYLEEDIEEKCTMILLDKIDETNVCLCYQYSIEYKSEYFTEICFKIFSENFNQILNGKPFNQLDPKLKKQFLLDTKKTYPNLS